MRGEAAAGKKIHSDVDNRTNVYVGSLISLNEFDQGAYSFQAFECLIHWSNLDGYTTQGLSNFHCLINRKIGLSNFH